MAYNQLITKSGHSLFTMSSLYQKAIRRCDVKAAGYAANELFDRYEHYLWKRTLVISAEDCYGECTQEILALYWASQEVNKGKKGNDRTKIFIAKAITILLYHAKSRDSDFFACEAMDDKNLSAGDLKKYFTERELYDLNHGIDKQINLEEFQELDGGKIPKYVYDCHTLEGKRAGKTKEDFMREEEADLQYKQLSFFDLEGIKGNFSYA